MREKAAAIFAEGESLPTPSRVGSTIPALFGLPFVVRIYGVLGRLPPERDAGTFGRANDAGAVCLERGTPDEAAIRRALTDRMGANDFPAGAMGPKVEVAQNVVCASGKRAVIRALRDVAVRCGETGIAIDPEVAPFGLVREQARATPSLRRKRS
ncbi:hypothetical protein [Salipiger bermudensis]|uniref:Carbamate kinase n=1 Tax=Salipiger bermudensis (strain DSM 26914 / JCM 13377 / KCTC 12554 / HTCC2601) TaxID=314265 RepID=Q0FS52_SALBH|nr:hypothetical protein [Salipiger bermudensis]EAU46907.1 carbamate kinase [Salipiger bermudensis HTCC2601]